ncbi:MAG: type I secretion system permease/ATPase [Pseudomonadota bacterium]
MLTKLLPEDHWLAGPVARNGKIYGQAILAAALINFLGLFSSFFIMTVYDRVLPNNAVESLVALTIGVMLAHLFDFGLKSVRGYFVDIAGQRLDAIVGNKVFDQLMSMRLEARKGGVGAMAGAVREFDLLKDFFSSVTLVTLVDVPFIALFVLAIAMIGGPIAFVPAVAIGVAIGASLLLQPVIQRHTKNAMGKGRAKHGVLIEALAGLETVKTAAATDLMKKRWQTGALTEAATSTTGRFLNQFTVNLVLFCQQAAQVGIVVAGVLLVGDGKMSMGALIACVILTGRAMAPLGQVANLLGRISSALAAYKSLNTLMSEKSEKRVAKAYLSRSSFLGRIEFRDVSFSYPDAPQRALDDVSFVIEPGERAAVLGRNGSGKSTIVRLALGVYEPTDGQVLIDDTDVRQIDPSDLRKGIGAMLQDVCLFSGTIRENITLGLEGISDENVLNAAQIAGAHEFIGATKDGYDMMLRERGEGISGGQKQTVALARALANNPSILLFDEPTSALDNHAEARLIARLREAVNERTLLLVTHRMPLLKLAEKIIVLDRGRLVVEGPREKVIRAMTGRAPAVADSAPNLPKERTRMINARTRRSAA